MIILGGKMRYKVCKGSWLKKETSSVGSGLTEEGGESSCLYILR